MHHFSIDHVASFWFRLFVGATVAGLLVVAVGGREARADCAAGSFAVFPAPGTTLPPNGRIVVEGAGDQVALVRAIAAHKPALVPNRKGKAIVPLKVLALHEGMFDAAQVVLAPVQPLVPELRYTLQLHGAREGEPKRWQPTVWTVAGTVARKVKATWPVAGSPDETPPRWLAPPKVRGTAREDFGCGPAVDVAIAAPVDGDASDTLALVELVAVESTPLGSPKPTRREYIVPVAEGIVHVGHGMCSGAFQLTPGLRYGVQVTAVDLAGNETPAPGERLEFVAPESGTAKGTEARP